MPERVAKIKIILMILSSGRMWNHSNSHTSLVRMQNYTDTLENSLVVFIKLNNTLTALPSNPTVHYLTKNKFGSTQKILHENL